MAIVTGSWKTQAAYVAARLGIADLLAAGARSAADLADDTGCHPGALHRLLRALATIELLRERADGTFELTATGSLLRSGASDSLRSWTLHWGGPSWQVWGDLLHSVTTGESARPRVLGSSGFDRLAADPAAAATFHDAMVELTRLLAPDFTRAVDWTGTRRIVDVGGGYGELLVAALTACPGASGVLFDAPHALEGARVHLQVAGLDHRCEFVAGDFLSAIPPGADTYLLKSVLHDWDDARARRILDNCRRAIARDGRLLVLERIVPRRMETSPADQGLACMDLHMLVQLAGRERTERELRDLLSAAGFRTERVTPLGSTIAVLEASPAGVASV
jgi:hypothetical protein